MVRSYEFILAWIFLTGSSSISKPTTLDIGSWFGGERTSA